MRQPNEPGPLLLILVIFSVFMLLESLAYHDHMKGVLYYRAHEAAANRLLDVDCKTMPPGNGQCLAAWEALSPMQTPVAYAWAQKLRGQKH